MSSPNRKNLLNFINIGVLCLAFCLMSGSVNFHVSEAAAASRYMKNGREYGVVRGSFRHRWWNYYERGLSFADGEFYPEAADDLKEALRQRKEDQRMARTYGMHFIDYFPNRELGIVNYQTGNLAEAKKLLELSISQFPSSKARFYLDKVRRELLEKTTKNAPPPNLQVDLEDEFWIGDDHLTIKGSAQDQSYVSSILINGSPVFLEESQQQISFQKVIPLSQGSHIIEVRAWNLLGKTSSRRFLVHVDQQGPMIAVEDIIHGAMKGEEVTVTGSIFDDSGVSEIIINGRKIAGLNQQEVTFSENIPAGLPQVEVVSIDRLGNRTEARINLAGGNMADRPVIRLAGLDPAVNHLILAEAMTQKNEPFIKLKDWTDKQTVYLDKIFLEGEVSATDKIVGLSVNREPILRRRGMKIFFNHLAELQEGENVFVIEAVSESGSRTSRTITVNRQVPKAFQLEERLSMTVMPFEQEGIEQSFPSASIQDNLINALLDENRFRVIERQKLDLILQEQKLSQTELVDRKTALRLGKLIAAQSVLTGSVVENSSGIEIVARLIDTETSEILATEDVYDEMKDIQGLRAMVQGMAIKFHHEFPLLDGLVVQMKGKNIFVDLDSEQIKLQQRLIVYREEQIKHPVTGKVLGSDNVIIGQARVNQVMPELARAELTGETAEKIQPLDHVVTQ